MTAYSPSMVSPRKLRTFSTISRVNPRMSSMKWRRSSFPWAICLRRNSHSPVNSGVHRTSVRKFRSSVMSDNPFAVTTSSFPLRSTYPSKIRPSIIWARVAGVPKPRSLIASRNSSSSTSLPAPSIAESNVASLKRAGGLVSFSLISIASTFARSLGEIGTIDCSSSPAASFP